jgi:hypothetical protein
VQRFPAQLQSDLFAIDGFHPNAKAHVRWGEEIAALALPLLEDGKRNSSAALSNTVDSVPERARATLKQTARTETGPYSASQLSATAS